MLKPSYKAIKAALAKHAKISVEIETEDLQIEGNASSIDEDTDREHERWIRDQLERGNEYAWCRIVVKASWRGFEGYDSLGACSYESRASLDQAIEYHGMRAEALIALANRVSESYEAISALVRGK